MNKLKLTHAQFEAAKQFIVDKNQFARLEVRMQDVWEAGSKATIYFAIGRESFSACSLTEKVIMSEALEMMREKELVSAETDLATA